MDHATAVAVTTVAIEMAVTMKLVVGMLTAMGEVNFSLRLKA